MRGLTVAAGAAMVAVIAGCGAGGGSSGTRSSASPEPEFAARFGSAPRALEPGMPIRIAEVDVGTVRAIDRESRPVLVYLHLRPSGLPIFRNAVLKIRPRLFARGYFIDLDPGSPGAGRLAEGGVIPASQTSGTAPTKQDVLRALEHEPRPRDLRRFVKRYGPRGK